MRVAIYERVSTEEQAVHGLSIDAQDAILRKWVKDNGHELVGVFVDAGISARKSAAKRPSLQNLLRIVEEEKVDLIIFTKLDRWFRNIREYYKVDELLTAHNVAWKAVTEDYETETANGRLKLNLLLAIAEQEADRTSERIKMVFDQKRARGEWAAGALPLGLSLDEKRKIVPDENADTIRKLFDYYIATRSPHQTMVYGAGIGASYTYTGMKRLLQNEMYVEYGVLDRETWIQAQAIHRTRSQRNSGNFVYLFSGLVVCAECGRRMGATRAQGKYVYYKCRGRLEYMDCQCRGGHREEKIEEYLLDQLIPKCAEFSMTKKEKAIDREAVKAKMDRLTEMYIEGRIAKERYERDYRALKDSLIETPSIDEKSVITALNAYGGLSRAGKKEFWSRVLREIRISEDGAISFDLNFV